MNNVFGCIVCFIYTRETDMNIFKRLVKGDLGLAVTFWVFGVLFSVILIVIYFAMTSIFNAYHVPTSFRISVILFIYSINFLNSILVLAGLFNLLKNGGVTYWRVIALVVWLCATVYSVYDDSCDILHLVTQ